ncbi:MAG: hypothetical protein N3F04_02150 [Candidatus Nezhaarchaeota archaeon]|nr:hypothetical protein [Candidatus Nezhaarchaeota archaeon]MCX8141581.1 hypothetical protein [Candidatus Nezhaarchaeota archaeon]MDW8049848.1 hypothetical protein [Nitrososphaerota archaeon]
MEVERFEVYGVGVNYPKEWIVEFRKLRREDGEVIFRSNRGSYMTLLWGPLSDALKRHDDLDSYVEYMVQSLSKSKQIKRFEILTRGVIEVNGHRALTAHMKISVSHGGVFTKSYVEQDVRTMHLFCDRTNRIMIIYSVSSSGCEEDGERAFKGALESFKCH